MAIQIKRIDNISNDFEVQPGQLILEYGNIASTPSRIKVSKHSQVDMYQNLSYVVPNPSIYRDIGIYFPDGISLNIVSDSIEITVDTVAHLNGSQIVTANNILDTGLKLIGVGTIWKSSTPYYLSPPEGTYIQNDNNVTFNDQAFLYDEGQSQYSLKHSYTSFVGYDHLVWDTTKNLYQFDPGPGTYAIKVVKITAYLSGILIPYTNEEAVGIWYGPYCSQGTDVTS